MRTILKYTGRVLFTAMLAASLASCGSKETAGEETTPAAESAHEENENSVEITQAQYQSIGVELGSPELKGLSALLKVNGYIDVPPQNLMSVTTQMGGIIKSTPLLQGSTVSKGQVIAVLQNQEFVQLQQDYLESKSQLELTDSEYKRQQTLASQNVNAQKTVQQARANYQGALARENALKQRLQLINISPSGLTATNIRSQINIYAPISGYVTKVNVNTGKFVNPNDVMFEIVNSSNLHVELNVFEKDAARVKPGQRVRFTLTNDTTEQNAVVQLVGGEINADKTVTVHAIAKGSRNFIPGTYLKAFIEAGSSQVMALPVGAVVDFEGKKYIFLAKETKKDPAHKHSEEETEAESEKAGESHHFEMVAVTTGISDGGYIEVVLPKNLDIKGKVVLKGTYDLLSKLKNSEESEGH
ncbi:efflux RND transporter periplasmic adaptor subunit [Pedobacter sp. Du54]|uniref:efflux RND transporter periplasmic adaptor subunit n=1 Tax=Pedobacter anseongensis TaxID=3133439 RepID=UPI0030A2F1EF